MLEARSLGTQLRLLACPHRQACADEHAARGVLGRNMHACRFFPHAYVRMALCVCVCVCVCVQAHAGLRACPACAALSLLYPKMAIDAKRAFFVAMALGRARQAAGERLTGKSGLPGPALFLSA